MKKLLLIAMAISPICHAAPDCSAVLIPTVEQAQSEYSMLQAYMRINASEEYDRLKLVDNEGRSAQASYKLFSAEYEDSKNKEEFREKINKRLEREGFTLSVSESKAAHRRFLTEAQISGWKVCVANQAQGGSILLQARDISKEGFPLRIDWVPQKGKGEGDLSLNIVGGKIGGVSDVNFKLVGANTLSKIVVPDSGKDAVLISANIEGNADDIKVNLNPTPKPIAYNYTGRVTICSGNICSVGDWGVGNGFPTPYGDCTVGVVFNDLDSSRRVISIDVVSIEALSGAQTDFKITKTEMHPSAYDNAAVRKNLHLCGYVKEIKDRRAILQLGVRYE